MRLVERYFKPTNHVISNAELFNRAHRVKTFSGQIFVNHQNGLFYATSGNQKLTLEAIYPLVAKVFTTDRRLIGRRRKIGSPLIAGHEMRKYKSTGNGQRKCS